METERWFAICRDSSRLFRNMNLFVEEYGEHNRKCAATGTVDYFYATANRTTCVHLCLLNVPGNLLHTHVRCSTAAT